jgi:myo-inositol 2-dehydrogenase/D-chiro-inositol 1-dehydrogenase
MTARLPIGVIGLGRMGQIYARHLARRVPQAHLVAVADVIEERARTLADELEVGS